MKVFRTEGLDFPSRLRGEATVFRPLTASTAMRTLNNPRYAGVYAYGRRQYRRAGDGKKTIQRKREDSDWLACIPKAHPGYISWERFQENLRILESKRPWLQCGARVAAPRRSGVTARTRRLRAVRKALSRPICRAAWKTGSLVRL